VISRLSDEVYQFLLQTSILTQLTASLCAAVTGNANSQTMLERLEQANLFTFALDDQRRWYRYHRLMVDFLRHRLHKEYGDQMRDLHQRAADWCKVNGMPEVAIEHLLDAADYSHAAALLELYMKEDTPQKMKMSRLKGVSAERDRKHDSTASLARTHFQERCSTMRWKWWTAC
jgi:ATP/maltotriose-dependent transcriptional regulator MalT